MKVLLITDSDPRKKINGGVGVYTYYLLKFLEKNKIPVTFIGKNQSGEILETFKNMEFIPVNDKPDQKNYIFLKNLYKVAKTLKLDSDTVIHAHRPDWLVPFAKFPNLKVTTLHGCHRKNVFLKKGKIWGHLYARMEKKGFHVADIIHSVSYDAINYYKEFYPENILDKIKVVPVGTNLNIYTGLDKAKSRKKYGFKSDDKVVVFIGRFEKEKRHEWLVEACSKIGAIYWMIGSGAEKDNLAAYAKKIGCDLRFHDPVPNSYVPEMFAAADCFGLTSRYEGFPMNIVEALATGIPSVATDVGDVAKVIKDGKTGYIVDHDNVAEKLDLAIKNSAKFKTACLKEAKDYDWDVIGRRMLRLYKDE